MVVGTVMVKLVPAVRALTVGCSMVVLQVTLNAVPSEESKVNSISLVAVTAVVLTTSVVPAAGTATSPAEADEQTAGDALLAQFVAVDKDFEVRFPMKDAAPVVGVSNVLFTVVNDPASVAERTLLPPEKYNWNALAVLPDPAYKKHSDAASRLVVPSLPTLKQLCCELVRFTAVRYRVFMKDALAVLLKFGIAVAVPEVVLTVEEIGSAVETVVPLSMTEDEEGALPEPPPFTRALLVKVDEDVSVVAFEKYGMPPLFVVPEMLAGKTNPVVAAFIVTFPPHDPFTRVLQVIFDPGMMLVTVEQGTL